NLFYLSRWEEREAKKKAVALPGPLRRVSDLYNEVRTRLRRRRWVVKRAIRGEAFVDGCRALFRKVPLEPGDIVMLPTVSDDERGHFALPDIVRAISGDLLRPRLAQILVQRENPDWHVPFPEDSIACPPPVCPVLYQPPPLSRMAYNDLIRGAHVGFLLHDAH